MHIHLRSREIFFIECEKCVDMSLEENSIMHVVTLLYKSKRKTCKKIYKERNTYIYSRQYLGDKNMAIYCK